jgi:hypothetical protein
MGLSVPSRARVLVVLLPLLSAPGAAQIPLQLIVPVYSYPCPAGEACTYECDGQTCTDQGFTFWSGVARAARGGIPTLAIVNPDSGPGSTSDAQYRRAIDTLAAAGATRIGYVSTRYGTRDRDAIEADVRAWAQLYGGRVTGIFFDEVSSSAHPDTVALYDDLCAYATDRGLGFSVLNPGTVPAVGWSTTCDVVIAFENAYAGNQGEPGSSWPAHELPNRLRMLGRDRLGMIVHTTAGADMPAVIAEAAEQGYGYVYVTDDAETGLPPSPYNFLPAYWSEERGVIRGIITNGEGSPPRGIALALSPAYPNPATDHTDFDLVVDTPQRVVVAAFDALGRRVATLHDGAVAAGAVTRVTFDGSRLPGGVYVVRAAGARSAAMQRVTVVR